MANQVLPGRYAQALFEVAKKNDILSGVAGDLSAIAEALTGAGQFSKVLNHPGISRDEKKSLIKKIFGDKVFAVTLNFLYLLIDKKREKLLPEICAAFAEMAEETSGTKTIIVETASPLDHEEKEELGRRLEKVFKSKLKMDARVNEGLLGGIIIRDKMRMIDASVSHFLKSMKTKLRETKAAKVKKAAKPAVKKTVKKAVKKVAKKKPAKKAVKKKK